MTVGVVVSTFGDSETWKPWAERAIRSAANQSVQPDFALWAHEEDASIPLGVVRNTGASSIDVDHLIFLDADDELDPFYIEKMLEVDADVRQPSTLGVVNGVEDAFPVLIPRRNLLQANYIVVGAMMNAEAFWGVGGFDDYPILEDWALMLKLYLTGAVIKPCPEAIYRVTVRPESRNQNEALHGKYYAEIQKRFWNEAKEKGL